VSDAIQTYVEFRSSAFLATDGEERQVNPGLWGKRLADFLCEKLRDEGFETEAPFAEDWGWVVPVVNEGFRLWIGCILSASLAGGRCSSGLIGRATSRHISQT